jgi:hypothetical protein
MLTIIELKRLENFGFTEAGAAIVDAVWFHPFAAPQIGMVLICNPAGVWKAYLGTVAHSWGEALDAQTIAQCGAKVPYAIAKAAFPNRPFDINSYDTKN